MFSIYHPPEALVMAVVHGKSVGPVSASRYLMCWVAIIQSACSRQQHLGPSESLGELLELLSRLYACPPTFQQNRGCKRAIKKVDQIVLLLIFPPCIPPLPANFPTRCAQTLCANLFKRVESLIVAVGEGTGFRWAGDAAIIDLVSVREARFLKMGRLPGRSSRGTGERL